MRADLTFDEHSFYALLGFSCPFEEELKPSLKDLLEPPRIASSTDCDRGRTVSVRPWVPKRLEDGVNVRGEEMMLETDDRGRGGSDFITAASALMSNRLPMLCRIYKVSDTTLRLLNKGDLYTKETARQLKEKMVKHRLAIILKNSACHRISKNCQSHGLTVNLDKALFTDHEGITSERSYIKLKIENLHVYHFSTGRIICQVKLKAQLPEGVPMNSSVLAEINDHISRFANLAWLETHGSGQQATPEHLLSSPVEMTLGSIASRIVFGAKARINKSHRTYTYVFAKLQKHSKSDQEVLDLLSISEKLARQHTDNYQTLTGRSCINFQPFSNICHSIAVEGAATIVSPEMGSDIIENIENIDNFDKDSLPNK